MRPLLLFLNEVAGGRKLLGAAKERAPEASYVVAVAPANRPTAGQITSPEETAQAARSRVEVTLAVLEEFGIEAVGEVLDPAPELALGDAVRSHRPSEVLLSCLYETRFGFARRDLVEWAKGEFAPGTTVTHIPVRIEDLAHCLDAELVEDRKGDFDPTARGLSGLLRRGDLAGGRAIGRGHGDH
ncbi:MAG: hypothetical protein ACKORA_08055, partial [Solirubrobacterales bacterium]